MAYGAISFMVLLLRRPAAGFAGGARACSPRTFRHGAPSCANIDWKLSWPFGFLGRRHKCIEQITPANIEPVRLNKSNALQCLTIIHDVAPVVGDRLDFLVAAVLRPATASSRRTESLRQMTAVSLMSRDYTAVKFVQHLDRNTQWPESPLSQCGEGISTAFSDEFSYSPTSASPASRDHRPSSQSPWRSRQRDARSQRNRVHGDDAVGGPRDRGCNAGRYWRGAD